jgi:hypothetical protein
MSERLECLSEGPTACSGAIEYHRLPNAERAFPRCEKHWQQRVQEDEKHRQNYPDSPMAPGWFDPMNAGERWDDDY